LPSATQIDLEALGRGRYVEAHGHVLLHGVHQLCGALLEVLDRVLHLGKAQRDWVGEWRRRQIGPESERPGVFI
jgi:hypothetical protein